MSFCNFGSDSGHFYTEGRFRGGMVHNKFDSDLRDAFGTAAGYNASSTYYGLHLTGGRIWNIGSSSSFDLYGRYSWAHLQGDSVTLTTGEPLVFDVVNSHRLRFGGRFGLGVSRYVIPYLGAAWEQELDGKARSTVYGYATNAPSLQGGTGIGELGVSY